MPEVACCLGMFEFNPLRPETPKGKGTMANSEDPDEMPALFAYQINLQRKKFIIFINYNRSPLNLYIEPL